MANDVIEAVAQAICIAMGDDPAREGERLTGYDELATAALTALAANVTPAMVEAGMMALSAAGWEDADDRDVVDVYLAMLAAARAEAKAKA